MSKAFIAYRNLADAATITSSQPALEGYPLSNVKLRSSGKFTRLPVLGSTITLDFGTAVLPRFLGLFGVNMFLMNSLAITVERSTNNTTFSVVPTTGTIPDEGVRLLPNDVKVVVDQTAAPARWWRIAPLWNRPVGQTWWEIGRIWASGARDWVEIEEGIDARPQFNVADLSIGDMSAGGQFEDDRRTITRQVSASLTSDDMKLLFGIDSWQAIAGPNVSSLQDAQMTAGITGEIVWSPGQTALLLHRLGFRGRLPRGISIVPMEGNMYSVSFDALEER